MISTTIASTLKSWDCFTSSSKGYITTFLCSFSAINFFFQVSFFSLFCLLVCFFVQVLNETMSYDAAHNLYKSNFDEQQIEQAVSKFREVRFLRPMCTNFRLRIFLRTEYNVRFVQLADHAVTNPALFGGNEFFRRLLSFIKALAIVGALLFFVTMKHKLSKAKKESKVKTDQNYSNFYMLPSFADFM